MSAVIGNPLLLGPEGYQISRSVRLRSSASAYFNRTNASSPTNAIKWTWSGWVKRGSLGAQQNLVGATNSGSDDTYFNFNSSDQIVLGSYTGAGTDYGIKTSAVFRDPSAWYHIVAVLDTANATSTDRAIIYVNGVRQTVTNSASGMWPQNATNNKINTASQVVNIGRRSLGDSYLDGYLTEVNFIDGQALTPSSFGETDTVTGVWKPKKYAGTYGTNGFYLNFSDNSNNTAATIGKDYSGNGNNWTPNNISVTSGTTYDSMIDVPTPYADGNSGRGNYAVMNPLDAQGTATLSDANLTLASATTAHKNRKATFMLPSTGKWYWELTTASTCSSSVILGWGLQTTSAASDSQAGNANTWMAQNDANQDIFNQTTTVLSTGSAVTGGSIRQVAYDADTGKLWFGVNNSWYSSTDLTSGNPGAGTNQCMTLSAGDYFPAITCYNLTANANFGQRPFTYTPPSGFQALNTQNLPAPTISNGALYMAATTYTGTGATQTISNGNNNTTGVTFKPDFVFTKARSSAIAGLMFDSVRGATKYLQTNSTAAEGTGSDSLTAFASNGFTVGADTSTTGVNQNTTTYVGWQWQAGQGTTSSNTSGSITSTVSVNATAGFSVVTYTGNSTANATVGHGLGVAPNLVIIKARTSGSVENWPVYHSSLSAGQFLFLNTTNAVQAADGTFNSSTPVSSTVFQFGSPANTRTNSSSYAYVAYCFSAVRGYSAFGSYTGNGSATGDGPFVYLGFRPRFVMLKITTTAGYYWMIKDSSRDPYNTTSHELYANVSDAEYTASSYQLDFLSNGFKIKNSGQAYNGSGDTYIYAAFAENPLKFSLAR